MDTTYDVQLTDILFWDCNQGVVAGEKLIKLGYKKTFKL